MKSYPIVYPSDIPAGLVPSKCTGCGRLWWIEPPPTDAGHCMCCQGKLRFLIGVVPNGDKDHDAHATEAEVLACPICTPEQHSEGQSK